MKQNFVLGERGGAMRLIDADALMDNINKRIENMTSAGVMVDSAYLWALIYDEIKGAPTIEPNGIGRYENAMQKLREMPKYLNNIQIKQIQKISDEAEWIPCSEKLPLITTGEVLATTIWGEITIADRFSTDKWFIHEGNSNAVTSDILAWQPLPTPYKGGDTE